MIMGMWSYFDENIRLYTCDSKESNKRQKYCKQFEMDFKPSDGYFDLCINVTSEDMNHLNDVLLRLYQSELTVWCKK